MTLGNGLRISALALTLTACSQGTGKQEEAAVVQAPRAPAKVTTQPPAAIPTRVFFGDTHLHTSYSADAGMVGNRLGPEEAYRFARGEQVTSSTGLPAKLGQPLDFLVIGANSESSRPTKSLASAYHRERASFVSGDWLRKRRSSSAIPLS